MKTGPSHPTFSLFCLKEISTPETLLRDLLLSGLTVHHLKTEIVLHVGSYSYKVTVYVLDTLVISRDCKGLKNEVKIRNSVLDGTYNVKTLSP